MTATNIGALPIDTLLEQMDSDAIAPGAGPAAAIVLALAAACAARRFR